MTEHPASTRNLTAGLVVGLIALTFMTTLATPAAAYPRPGITERASVGVGGTQGDDGCYSPSVSADGRYVAFRSLASNLVPGDTNALMDVFLHDRETGVTERVSVGSGGEQGNSNSFGHSVSADGRFVAFQSSASNLVPGDIIGTSDVFVRNRETGVIERVSVASSGVPGNEDSDYPSISADGRYVAFQSVASNLVSGDTNETYDVFVHDRGTGVTERLSVVTGGAQGNDDSAYPSISGDGRYVAFISLASNLVSGDTNGAWDVFVNNRVTGATERVSVVSGGAQGNGESTAPSISADGRFVAFDSYASNLVPGDTNGAQDVFVRDRVTGTTERVSVRADGTEAGATLPSVSADGRFVAFQSLASLVPEDTNGIWDVFVHDRETGATERVSVEDGGAQGNGESFNLSVGTLSADGSAIAFQSSSSNLVPGDTNGNWDVFVRDRGPALGVGPLAVSCVDGTTSVSGWATFSGAVISSADDPANDGDAGAAAAGAELTGASLAYRPENGDLMVRLRVASLPAMVGGAPGVLYGLQLTLGVARYEARAVRAAATPGGPGAPYFGLYRCDLTCTEEALLAGGIGTTSSEIRISVPLAALGAAAGVGITDLRAYTAFGDATTGPGVLLDDVALAATSLPIHSVSLGIAPAGTPENGVVFDTPASLTDGDFSETLPSVESGNYDAWARACLGTACGTVSTPVTCTGLVGVPAPSPPLLLTLRGGFPSPFGSAARVSYALPVAGRVSVRIVDVQGRQVESLVEAWQEAGEHDIVWNAHGRPSGLYFVMVSSGGVTRQEKLIHAR